MENNTEAKCIIIKCSEPLFTIELFVFQIFYLKERFCFMVIYNKSEKATSDVIGRRSNLRKGIKNELLNFIMELEQHSQSRAIENYS